MLLPFPFRRRYRRRSARVLLVDRDDRLWMFGNTHAVQAPRGLVWFTPGGGVERGESLPVAAARELHEETGLRVRPEELAAPVAYSSGYAELSWARGVFRDDYFFHRVDRHEVDTRGFTKLELDTIVAQRWWSVAEITEAQDDFFIPWGLPDLLPRLLTGWRPASPVALPWHH